MRCMNELSERLLNSRVFSDELRRSIFADRLASCNKDGGV